MNNLNAKKITCNRSVKIVDSENGKYVIKKEKQLPNELFKYLNSKNFKNYLDYIESQDDFVIYPYIYSTINESSEKSVDLIEIIALLHKKTEVVKNFSIDEIKQLYEKQINKLNSLEDFYEVLRASCEEEKYLSPSKYYYLRNSSWIFHSIKSSKYFLDKWYSIVKNKKTKRDCLIHGNLELNHLLDSENKYLISWSKARNDMLVYDLISFYEKHFNEISFYELLKIYNTIYPMYDEELYYLFSLMFTPQKIIFCDTEIINVKNIYNIIERLKTSSNVISNYHSSNSNSESNEENK